MMATHTLLVKAYVDGEVKLRGAPVNYSGPPNWKFEPIDPAERVAWEVEAADPDRLTENLKQAGDWDYEPPPPPPQPYERGYTPEIIAGLEPREPRYDRYKDI